MNIRTLNGRTNDPDRIDRRRATQFRYRTSISKPALARFILAKIEKHSESITTKIIVRENARMLTHYISIKDTQTKNSSESLANIEIVCLPITTVSRRRFDVFENQKDLCVSENSIYHSESTTKRECLTI